MAGGHPSPHGEEEDKEVGGGAPRPGQLVHCRLLLRGVARATEAVVAEPGAGQTVIACPADCALDAAGGWAASPATDSWQVRECECATPPGASCGVVFYSVDTRALSTAELPDASRFRTSAGQRARPAAERLSELFRGEAVGGDALQMQAAPAEAGFDDAAATAAACAAAPYHEVRLGERHDLLAFNSVVVIPDFLSREECHVLIDAADRAARGGSSAANFYAYQEGMNRLPVRKLDLEAQMLSAAVVSERLLPFFEERMPEVADDLFGQSSRLAGMKMIFSPGEPAVNRYMVGGGILPHTDKQTVTMNVLLSDLGAFTGGGTVFWPEDRPETAGKECVGEVVLRARQGTAILFNGSVTHAGRSVTSGVRHTFVASFNLFSLEE